MESSKPAIQIVADVEAISRKAAEVIMGLMAETLNTKTHFSIALSGGSTPKSLFTLLADDVSLRTQVDWDKVHFFWGDERHIPPDHPDSNFRMANEVMLSKVEVPAENIHRVRAEEQDASKAAEEYEDELRTFFNLKPGELPRFDCVLLGMGPDGHTASLFPGTEALREQKRLVVSNWVEKFRTHRITLTAPAINNADCIIFLVSGEEKAEVLREVLEGEKNTELFPSQLIKPSHGKLLWLVAQSATTKLTVGK
jgi:6-phosphogluconolactonase